MSKRFKLSYISDLHLERRIGIPRFVSNERIGNNTLALIGDIGDPYMTNYREFLGKNKRVCINSLLVTINTLIVQASYHFENTIVVLGNHEFLGVTNRLTRRSNYMNHYKKTVEQARGVCNSVQNVIFLNNEETVIDGVRIAGSVLWTPKVQTNGIDFYGECVDFLRNTRATVVLTHYLPR